MIPLHVAISPCPNDSYIFGAWILGLTKLTGADFDVRFHWHDVQELNDGAQAKRWDIIKVSAATALRLEDYSILQCGGAFGLAHGPKLVTREDFSGQPKKIAVPGLDTTAVLVLRGAIGDNFEPVPMIFHAIVEAVQTGAVDAGLLIHETALVYHRYGLKLLLDLGHWWNTHTSGLPLPLGSIVARKNLGAPMHGHIEDLIRQSILIARKNEDKVMPLIAALARELDGPTLDQHIDAYVNDFSLNMGQEGISALNTLQTFRNNA